MVYCNSICLRYKKPRGFNTENSKYCSNCAVFLEFDGDVCPCCKIKMRCKPRTSRRARVYYDRYPEKIPKRIE